MRQSSSSLDRGIWTSSPALEAANCRSAASVSASSAPMTPDLATNSPIQSSHPRAAAAGAEDVAGQALAVDADEHGLGVDDRLAGLVEVADAALAQRQVRLRVDGALVGDQLELAPVGGEHHRLDPLDELLALEAVAD